ncbi:hypothetical protein MIND_01331400 [Mycena indigotica]|uniref:F-box domain-containing protein n=1 Tax=Mycena indigotica TaxID=2126181 RepID=A0A8H6RYP0_9AGAR|nr:uncharacterized protein MIND_01331400 [Mycena indigotica]KAF7290180.1 hypothetical protein MIND_01331400 [Mycena indigotica]
MHAALRVPELLDFICESLHRPLPPLSEVYEYQPGSELVRLACTCRAFYGSALRQLWRTVPLSAVLRLWPDDAWDTRSLGSPPRMTMVLKYARRLRDSDWDRIRAYEAHIRELIVVGSNPSLDVVLPTLASHLPITMFRNLNTLVWDRNADYIDLFLRTSVSHIVVEAYKLGTRLPLLLERISDSPCRLRSLTLTEGATRTPPSTSHSVFPNTPQVHHVFLEPISRFIITLTLCSAPLTNLHVPTLSMAGLSCLSRLASLHSLALDVLPRALALDSSEVWPFPELQELSITHEDTPLVARFLQRLRPGVPLRSFQVEFQPYPTADGQHDLFGALAACLGNATLEVLSLAVQDIYDEDSIRLLDDPELYVLPAETLRLLLSPAFKSLRHVTVASALGFGGDIDDDFLEDLARAWPAAETITLLGPAAVHRPACSLKSLASLQRECPALQALTLRFAVESVELSVPAREHPLTRLDVQNSPFLVDNLKPRRVARYLAALFPHLRAIATAGEYSEGFDSDSDEDEEEFDYGVNELPDHWLRYDREKRWHKLWKAVEARLN